MELMDDAAYKAACRRSASMKYEIKRRARQAAVADFVAIDSEGGAIGDPILEDGRSYQPHKSFLWGAGDINGSVKWLYSIQPLSSRSIVEFLLRVETANPKATFIAFAFGYDVGQLVADLPYEKAWELQHGKPWADKDNKDVKSNNRRIVRWQEFGLQYLKGKSLSLFRYREGSKKPVQSMRIYDVFGFYQASFLSAIRTMPGVATEHEYAIIEKGKSERGLFYHSNIDEIKDYTRHELMVLCRMQDKLRQALASQDIHLTSWYGAGSIAQALMKREHVKPHLGERKGSDISEAQEWAHRAYFGGRIELTQQGRTKDRLYGYDIASAYPAAAAGLPSMLGGYFTEDATCELPDMSRLSMARVTATFPEDLPWYPLPYRTKSGAIVFPRKVRGVYMRDELLAACTFIDKFGGSIGVEKILQFVPAEAQEKPLNFLRQMFDYRLTLPKSDITQIVIKLGINSVYGKLAQAVGAFGKAPALACPWYAAAITAWTRAQLVHAALSDPEAVVMFATDGIISTRPLPVHIPTTKTLGGWEGDELPQGGVFIQSGFYAFADKDGKWKSKSRGFRPTNIEGSVSEFLRDTIPAQWRAGADKFEFPYQSYMTLGSACVSSERWQNIGQWVLGTRDLDLRGAGSKRDVTAIKSELRARASRLVPTSPADRVLLLADENGDMPLSEPSKPEWLDALYASERADDIEQREIEAGFT